jgi:NAD(P)-dependent dehydrogenase (short-subunit alcohol dehydrogenase family)
MPQVGCFVIPIRLQRCAGAGNSIAPTDTLFSAVLDIVLQARARPPLDRRQATGSQHRYHLRRCVPEEPANLAAYLVTEQAAYVNGACVVIDGGE